MVTVPRGVGRIEFGEGEYERMQRERGEKVGRSITLAGARFYEPKILNFNKPSQPIMIVSVKINHPGSETLSRILFEKSKRFTAIALR